MDCLWRRTFYVVPNALALNRATLLDRNAFRPKLRFKIGTILEPRSGISALFGRHAVLALIAAARLLPHRHSARTSRCRSA